MSAATVPARTLSCPRCGRVLERETFTASSEVVCPGCNAQLHGAIFPAFSATEPEAAHRAESAGEGEAVCFFHAGNRAALTCESCGRFICSVCEITLGSRRMCPACLSSGLTGKKLPELVPWRFQWADAALITGTLPILFAIFVWPFIVGSGALAVFLGIYGWNRPGSPVRGRRRWAAVLGIVGGLVQIAAWFAVILFIWKAQAK